MHLKKINKLDLEIFFLSYFFVFVFKIYKISNANMSL